MPEFFQASLVHFFLNEVHLLGSFNHSQVLHSTTQDLTVISFSQASVSEKSYLTLFDADDVVYLTPDSPNGKNLYTFGSTICEL